MRIHPCELSILAKHFDKKKIPKKRPLKKRTPKKDPPCSRMLRKGLREGLRATQGAGKGCLQSAFVRKGQGAFCDPPCCARGFSRSPPIPLATQGAFSRSPLLRKGLFAIPLAAQGAFCGPPCYAAYARDSLQSPLLRKGFFANPLAAQGAFR